MSRLPLPYSQDLWSYAHGKYHQVRLKRLFRDVLVSHENYISNRIVIRCYLKEIGDGGTNTSICEKNGAYHCRVTCTMWYLHLLETRGVKL
ncbi:uncharacterized protein PHALS_15350 [Plasmopara halstedii]|uniref:Uncharacterized protein n=1 Tax=Plasmopara halstedii TaxID=4781 RepID=A0A0P1AT59_PLAHL|nr:uncharacterized protein PHALS_15350 [Plasmopara halstedii]CEG44608.1 hypothetical protein PHALS_15350 [Plasmopara halstedii]|eukprot:XP_024580977.1 hypothetical protein PHALS_15350 [Plasmopara halstedii]